MEKDEMNAILLAIKDRLVSYVTEVKKEVDRIKEKMDTVEESVATMERKTVKVVEEMKNEMETFKKQLEAQMKKEMMELTRRQGSTGLLTSSVASTKVKPPTYDGQTSFHTYKVQFEAAAKANQWNEDEKATALVVSLRDQARDLLRTLPNHEQADYERLVSALELRFGDHHLQQVFQSQLRGRRQKSGETLQEYESDIKRLIYLAYPSAPTEFMEQLAAQTFIEGIEDTEIQRVMRLSNFRTSREALVRALEIEAAYKISDQRPSFKVRGAEIEKDIGEQLLAAIHEMRTKMKTLASSREPQRRNITCYGCGKVGHLRRDCSAPSKGRNPPRQQPSAHQQEKLRSASATGRPLAGIHQPAPKTLSIKQIKRTPGRQHNNADALSRRPCGDCKHCTRVENHDDAVKIRTTTVHVEDWTAENLREAQEKDPDVGPILKYKEEGSNRPEWQEVSDKSPTLKNLWAQWDSLQVEDGLLKRIWESPDGKRVTTQLVVPQEKLGRVLWEVHNGASGGHLGVNKTLAKIRERYYWVNCREDVAKWCRKCVTCAASKGPRTRTRGAMKQYNVGAPFERIAIDVAGPFPTSTDGNKYILVAMDYFSKWPEAYAIPNQEATTVARVLVDNWVCRFGVPMELHSDQGRNFESKVFQELCSLLGIEKTRTTPLHPQSDGMVERFNQTMEQHLSKVVEKHQRDWDQHLPLLLLAYRTAVHDTTGQTPAKVVFGRELRLPCDLMFGSPRASPKTAIDFVDELRETMADVHESVRAKIQASSDRMKTRYDRKANHGGFEAGDLVWLFNPQRKKGVSPKLTPDWEGPYKVIKRINDLVYRIQRSSRTKMKVVHLNRLCKYDGEISDWN